MSFGRYQFLSWARRGVARAIGERDTLGRSPGTALERARIPLTVSLDSGDDVAQNFALTGPGDVTGISPKTIIRTEPPNGTGDFEPNYLPCVEFYDEDFPFRYTPAVAAGGDLHLRPWLALVVLKQNEFIETVRREPLTSIRVTAEDVLPPHDELHLWCHMHSNLPHTESRFEAFLDGLEADVKKDPDGIYSRLLCPRKLEPKSHYHAFLVPTFETGRRAGLGQSVVGVPAQQSAWPGEDNELPVYSRFEFRTGKNFDFEYLVKQLRPRVMDPRVGVREMDCSRPGFVRADSDGEVRAPTPSTLLLEGALMAPHAKRSTFPPPSQAQPFFDDMSALVNLNRTQVQSDDEDPIVSVPFYGMYHALRRDRNQPGNRDVPIFNPRSTHWYNDLNRDPRTRVPAGFGKRVVQENQEKFANAAWQQLGDVLEANRKARQARFSATVMQQVYDRTLARQDPSRFLASAGPLMSRIRTNAGTVRVDIERGVVSNTMFTGTLSRITRPTTSLARGLAQRPRGGGFELNSAVKAMNRRRNALRPDVEGTLNPVPAINNFDRFTLPASAAQIKVWSGQSNLSGDFAMNQNGFAGGLPPVSEWLTFFDPNRFRVAPVPAPIATGPRPTVGRPGVVARPTLPGVSLPVGTGVRAGVLTGLDLTVAAGVLERPRDVSFVDTTVADNRVTARVHNRQVRAAFSQVNARLDFAPTTAASSTLAITSLRNTINEAITPSVAYARRLGRLVRWPEGAFRPTPELFIPAMAYPDLPEPTYKYLVDIDREFLLPNLDLIENNTLSLLKTNQKFIESYLVGMNYEMGRELMWREYPTDMRGSYFRQFWDVSGFVTPDTTPRDAQSLKDIDPIHTWRRASKLGRHNARDAEGDDEQLVFVIRGDLLRKFPNTVIYAQKAIAPPDPTNDAERVVRTDDMTDAQAQKEIRFPLYQAQLEPDIKLLGFDLTVDEASGKTRTPDFGNDRLGWYFIIAEVPGEPRFGMDITFMPNEADSLTWNDLSWKNLPTDTRFVRAARRPAARSGRPFPSAPEGGRWGHSAADMAAILLQRPAMVAIHATEMLESPTPRIVDLGVTVSLAEHLVAAGLLRR